MAVSRKKSVGILVNHDVRKPYVVKPPSALPDITGRLDRYDIGTATWSRKTGMTVPRAGFVMESAGEFLYAIGGTNGAAVLKSVEEYDTFTDTWETRTDMPTPRCYMQSVVHDSYIYCIGGLTANGIGTTSISRQVERYDAIHDTWAQMEPMPADKGIMMGTANLVGDKIYIIGGYEKEYFKYSTSVYVYDISDDSWTELPIIDDDEAIAASRLLHFSFAVGSTIYFTNGVYYSPSPPVNDDEEEIPPVMTYLSDAWKYNTLTDSFSKADRDFENLPETRYGGTSTTQNGAFYFIGGVSDVSNTLRFFEKIDPGSSPFDYTALTKLTSGRSSHGSCAVSGDYGDAIFVSGGVISKLGEDFLKVTINAIQDRVQLNGRQTAAVNIFIADENNDAPDEVLVRISATANTGDVVLLTEDEIVVQNGKAMATLLPRADDSSGSIAMNDATERSYSISVSGSIIDTRYIGDTDPGNDTTTSGGDGGVSGGDVDNPPLTLPPEIIFKRFESVIDPDQTGIGSFVRLSTIGGFVSLVPTSFGGGKNATIEYYSDIRWLPVVVSLIDDNEGSYERLRDALDRITRALPFGGSPLLDSIYRAGEILDLDGSLIGKLIYVQTDGDERNSHYSLEDVLKQLESLPDSELPPTTSSVFRVVPTNLHLDQGVRAISTIPDALAKETGASALYVTTDENVNDNILSLLTSQGFLGLGIYSCQFDLGEEVMIESITAHFDTTDPLTSGTFRFAVADESKVFSLLSDRKDSETTVTLFETVGRYINFVAELEAEFDLDVYNATKIVPPKLTSVDIVYHKKTESYIYWNGETTTSDPHQISITLDVNRTPGSEINVGVNTSQTNMWEDYDKPSSPAMENDSRIVVPIRRALNATDAFTLEKLISVDGFIYEASYGRWTNDATVKIYDADENEVDALTYKAYPDKGYIVFNTKTVGEYFLSIENKPKLSVATKIVNRVSGNPMVLTGAGYMFSTLDLKSRTKGGTTALPEAINLLLTPLRCDANSVFTANYSYYDLSGRDEKNSAIKWYINDKLEADISDLIQWDNKDWKLAKAGDSIYFTVEPKNDRVGGRVVRSLPSILAG